MVGDRLAREVSAQAPEVRITFRQVPATLIEDPAAQLAAVDGLFMPHGIISGLPAVELFRDRWLCAVAEDNPEVGESITLDQLAALPWATYQRVYDAPVTRQLSLLGIEPRVQVSVDSFQALPAMVAGTRRVAMIQARLAARLGLGPGSGIRLLDCPFEAVPVQEALWWHPVTPTTPATCGCGNRWRGRRPARRLRLRLAPALLGGEKVPADHHAQRLQKGLLVGQGRSERRAVSDPQDQSGKDSVEGRPDGGLRVGVVDSVPGAQQQARNLVTELPAVVGATAIDLRVHSGDEHDRAQESGVAEEDGRDLPDHRIASWSGGRSRQRSSSVSTAWSALTRAMPCS